MNKLKGWKTIVLGVAYAVIGALSNADMQAFISAHIPEVAVATGTIIVVMRWITTTPILKNK